MYRKVTAGGQFPYSTRQAATCPTEFSFTVQHPSDNGTIRQTSGQNLGMSKEGWCWRSVELYNRLPTDLRLELVKFKTKLKNWVEKNIKNLNQVSPCNTSAGTKVNSNLFIDKLNAES